eukprot:TRINITY_DN103716_c0_g1_i1.p1 TRINITY_DN103716_c0_g1~~TRINITY_DN103716_c0_g1_i1.p1  ORF type:complete len:372 (+),score=29.62 TRINITY_DN103716_c0_g1_i1:38-1117(+)
MVACFRPSMSILTLALLPFASVVQSRDLNLFMWNPHWQCFVWNNFQCAKNVTRNLEVFLPAFSVDFAGVVELGDSSWVPPSPFSSQSSKCNRDITTLFANTERWAASTANGSYVEGCMAANDRPFLVRQFDSVDGKEKLIVAAAHFPHPAYDRSVDVYKQTASTAPLRDAIRTVMQATGVEDVVVIADTNAWSWISSDFIMKDMLELPGTAISTKLESTCCFDAGYPEEFTFDRIMANFGGGLSTTVLFEDVPVWANQTKESTCGPRDPCGPNQTTIVKRGAFHKPVLARLDMETAAPWPSLPTPEKSPMSWTLLIVTISMIACCLLLWLALKCKRSRVSARRILESMSDNESSGSESS